MMAITGVTEIEEPFFEIEQGVIYNTLLPQYNRRLHIDLVLDPRVTLIDRQVYNFFMLLGDVGGLSGLLFSLGSIFLGFLNY